MEVNFGRGVSAMRVTLDITIDPNSSEIVDEFRSTLIDLLVKRHGMERPHAEAVVEEHIRGIVNTVFHDAAYKTYLYDALLEARVRRFAELVDQAMHDRFREHFIEGGQYAKVLGVGMRTAA
jgi:hypothetical protein